ncbi:PadR family transcriptional regulator [Candidatus Woesearchaeota archaeon]|nr:PadR family transcriptional regulator [Candidatus Woesearchaeota archaeon]
MESCCSMKGFLTFIVLRLISKKNMSGEDIREEIRKRKGTRPSPGTVYPVLKYLNKNKFIEEISSKGKIKRYKITKKGKKELNEATNKFCMLFYDMKDDISRRCN